MSTVKMVPPVERQPGVLGKRYATVRDRASTTGRGC